MLIKQTSAVKRVNHSRNLPKYDVKTKGMRNDLPIFPSLESRSVEYIVKGLPIVEHLITIMEKVRLCAKVPEEEESDKCRAPSDATWFR